MKLAQKENIFFSRNSNKLSYKSVDAVIYRSVWMCILTEWEIYIVDEVVKWEICNQMVLRKRPFKSLKNTARENGIHNFVYWMGLLVQFEEVFKLEDYIDFSKGVFGKWFG